MSRYSWCLDDVCEELSGLPLERREDPCAFLGDDVSLSLFPDRFEIVEAECGRAAVLRDLALDGDVL